MANVKYIGDLSPVNVKLPLGTQANWKKNEIRNLPEKCANKITSENCNFIKVSEEKKRQVDKPVIKEEDERVVEKIKKEIKLKEEY